jgi:putative tricarboxylic transport membrane protein
LQATRLSRLISLVLLCGAGVVAIVMALRLGLWRDGSPGPGLFPFFASVGIVTLSAAGMMIAFLPARAPAPQEVAPGLDRRGIRRVAFYVVTLLGYALLLEVLGFYVATTLALLLILWLAERLSWWVIGPLIAGALIFTHLLFARWLGVYFPGGWLWDAFF